MPDDHATPSLAVTLSPPGIPFPLQACLPQKPLVTHPPPARVLPQDGVPLATQCVAWILPPREGTLDFEHLVREKRLTILILILMTLVRYHPSESEKAWYQGLLPARTPPSFDLN